MATNDNHVFESEKHVVLTYINHWENHSIAKIRSNAEAMRNELREILAERREHFANTLTQIQTKLETHPDEVYDHLNQWTAPLTRLRDELLNFSSSIHLERESKSTSINLLKLCYEGKKIRPMHEFRNEDAVDVPGTKILTKSMLRKFSPRERKQMLGERLCVLVQQIEPNLAAKITGMFLELDTKYILTLIASPQILLEKVKEARSVLQAYAERQRYVSQP